MKKLLLVLALFVIAAATLVYFYGQEIFQYSAETLIKKNLPVYVKVDRIIFDLENGQVKVKNLRVKNPRGYMTDSLAEIELINCKYKAKKGNILQGIIVTEISADKPTINIERRPDGRLNLNDMGEVMSSGETAVKAAPETGGGKARTPDVNKGIAQLLTLTDTIEIKKGKVYFLDSVVSKPPYKLVFDNVNGTLVMKLKGDFTSVLTVSSTGSGFVNSDPAQKIDWKVSLDPRASALTMSNRFEIHGVEITQFRPYYDPYLPITITQGWCSGTLVFDFDRGNIGSMNTLVLKRFRFAQKKEGQGSSVWQSDTIPRMIEYLRSSPDEITFDFKIKGTMQDPKFYPGDHVKKAITAMTVDTISDALKQSIRGEGQPATGEKSDAERVVDVLQELLKR